MSERSYPTYVSKDGGNVYFSRDVYSMNSSDKITEISLLSYADPENPVVIGNPLSLNEELSSTPYVNSAFYPYWLDVKDCYRTYTGDYLTIPVNTANGYVSVVVKIGSKTFEYPHFYMVTDEPYISEVSGADNNPASEYFTYFIYGGNLTSANAFSYYDKNNNEIAKYVPDDSNTGIVKLPGSGTLYQVSLKKINPSSSIWKTSFGGHCNIPESIPVEYGDNEAYIYHEYNSVYATAFLLKKGSSEFRYRLYLTSDFAKKGDTVKLTDYSGKGKVTKTVAAGTSRIYIDVTSEEYDTYSGIKNTRTGKTAYYYYSYDDPAYLTSDLVIPANTTWKLIDPINPITPIYSGTTTSQASVLTKLEMSTLSLTGSYYYLWTSNTIDDSYYRRVFFDIGKGYSVTWNLNEAKGMDYGLPTLYFSSEGLDFSTLPAVTTKGYSFGGWYSDSKFTKKVTKIAPGTTGNKSFYAKWIKNKSTFTFKANDEGLLKNATGTMSPVTIVYSETGTRLPANKFAVKGYTFTGWKYSDNSRSLPNQAYYFAYSAENVTLLAQWEPTVYKINYHTNGVVNPGNTPSYTVADWGTTNVVVNDGVIPDELSDRIEFQGWYRDADYKIPYTGLKEEETGDINLYAKVVNKNYTIVFEDGQGNTVEQTLRWNVPTALKANTFTYTGLFEGDKKVFMGWYGIDADDNTFDFVDKQVITGIENCVPDSEGKYHLKANWQSTFIINYMNIEDADSASIEGLVGSYTYGVGVTNAALYAVTPTRIGFTFDGWYSDTNYKKKVTSISNKTYDTVMLYAKWKANAVKITFNSTSYPGALTATGKIKAINADTSQTIKLPKNGFTAKGGRFASYEVKYTVNGVVGTHYYCEGTKINILNLFKSNGNITNIQITALFSEDYYGITYYNVLKGVSNSNRTYYTYSESGNAAIPLTALEPPTGNTGYTFEGWYTDAKLTKRLKNQEIAKGSTGDINLYAKWNKELTVEYRISESSKSIAESKGYSIKGSNITKTVNTSSPIYTPAADQFKIVDSKGNQKMGFVGWKMVDNPSMGILNAKQQIPLNQINSGINTIVFEALFYETFTVTYIFDTVDSPSMQSFTYGVGLTSSQLKAPTRTGYTFSGWYTDRDYKKKVTSISKTATNITLYAKWNPKTYKVTYVSVSPNGKKVTGSTKTQTVKYGSNQTLNKNGFKVAGYEFGGWRFYDETIGNYRCISDKSLAWLIFAYGGEPKNITLYTTWKSPVQYNITYVTNADNATFNNGMVSSYNVNQTVTLSEPTRPGYTFLGWYTDKKCTKKATDIKEGTTGDKTYYAKWKLIQ